MWLWCIVWLEKGEPALLFVVIWYIPEGLPLPKKLSTIILKKGDSQHFFRKKNKIDRFGTDDLGVTQPSQVRYILYFYQIFKEKFLSPTVKFIDNIILHGVPNFNGKNSCKPIIEFISVKTDEKVIFSLNIFKLLIALHR